MWVYITEQGDTWDVLAFDFYGTEKFSHRILQANPKYRHIIYLPAGLPLNIPETDITEQFSALPTPPWERK